VGKGPGEAARTREKMREKGEHHPRVAAQQLFRAVADVALAEPRARRIDGDDERRESRGPGSLDGGRGDVAAADQIDLVPDGPARRGLDVFQPASGQGRQHVGRPGCAGGAGGGLLPAWPEHPAAPDGPEQQRKLEARPQDGHPKVALRNRDRVAGTEDHLVEDPTVLLQRELGIGAAIDVVEHRSRQPALGQAPEVADVENAWRIDLPRYQREVRAALRACASVGPAAPNTRAGVNGSAVIARSPAASASHTALAMAPPRPGLPTSPRPRRLSGFVLARIS